MSQEIVESVMDKGAGELGEIVVFVDGATETAGILEFAGVLAQEHGARLTAVFMQPEPAVTPPETFARGEGILNVIDAHRAQLERIEAQPRARFEAIVHRHAWSRGVPRPDLRPADHGATA